MLLLLNRNVQLLKFIIFGLILRFSFICKSLDDGFNDFKSKQKIGKIYNRFSIIKNRVSVIL